MTFSLALLALFSVTTVEPPTAAPRPMPKDVLYKQADLVITGRVLRVKKNGKPYKDGCSTWQKYQARIEVNNVKKGREKGSEKTKVVTVHYPTSIISDSKSKCGGPLNSYALSVGTSYELFLKAARKTHGHFVFINRDGVKKLSK